MTYGARIDDIASVQRCAWRERVLPPVEHLRPGVWSIPVPMPDSPLRYVLVYALLGEDAVTIIDAGWDSDDAWQALCDGLAQCGTAIGDVDGVLATHQHLDHVGLADRVRSTSGAWIAMHSADIDALQHPEFRVPDLAAAADRRWLTAMGASDEEAVRLTTRTWDVDPRSTVAIPDRVLRDGEELRAGERTLRVVHTPGHTPGHCCFADVEAQLLFGGDHLLPRITPHIAAERRPENASDTLGDYLDSLRKITSYDGADVLPAHEWRFRGAARRAREIGEHHQRRLDELLAVIRSGHGVTPWEVAAGLTWSRPWDHYDGQMRIFAINETQAHIVHLERQGLIAATSGGPSPRYEAIDEPSATARDHREGSHP